MHASRNRFMVATVTAAFATLVAPVLSGQATGTTVAFVNVNVVVMEGEGVLEGHTVIVRGDRIVEVGVLRSTPKERLLRFEEAKLAFM